MTGIWVAADVISAVRMNEKTIFQGTGAAISGLATTYPGMLAFCTSTGSGFTVDVLYQRNTANTYWSISGGDQKPYLTPSTTIGDYTTPDNAVVSSSASGATTTTYNHHANTGSSSNALASDVGGGVMARYGVRIITAAPAIGTSIKKIKASLKKAGTPTGNITFTVRNSSDTIVASATLDSATLTTSYADYEVTLNVTILLEVNFRVMIEFAGGNFAAGNSIRMEAEAITIDTGYQYTQYDTAYDNGTNPQPSMTFDSTPVVNIIDGDTATSWTSNSEANPNAYIDLTSIREIVGIALNVNKTTTTITSLKIRASTDTTFTDAENIAYVNISDFTDDTWRFMANNFLSDNRRYVQFYANETGVLSINEVKVRYGVTDLVKLLTHVHRTRSVDTTNSFTDSN